MHAKIIKAHPKSNLKYVYDVNSKLANDVVKLTGWTKAKSIEQAINSRNVDAVLIASATPTHTKYITLAAKAGKAIFCEKPIDLNINNVNACQRDIKNFKVPIQIGFNRRFDLSHLKAQKARANKEIGELEMIVITSRDPKPPGIDYLKAAGGFFRDTTIHDFDLTRFILGDDPVVQVSAFGDALFDKNSQQVKDLDTAMFILKSKNGVLIHINNSRRAVYGYDQRVEVLGSKGLTGCNNKLHNDSYLSNSNGSHFELPMDFFIDRYSESYINEIKYFIKCLKNNMNIELNSRDGILSTAIAFATTAATGASTGALSFSSAPNFESPSDANSGNDYVGILKATDSQGIISNQTVTVTVDGTNYSAGQRFAYVGSTGTSTDMGSTFQATLSAVNSNVLRLQTDASPNTDDITKVPENFTIIYSTPNPTYNSLYIPNHKVLANAEATYNNTSGTAIPPLTDGQSIVLSRLSDTRLKIFGGAASSNKITVVEQANNNNTLTNQFLDLETPLGFDPSTATITMVEFRGDFGWSSEYVTLTLSLIHISEPTRLRRI